MFEVVGDIGPEDSERVYTIKEFDNKEILLQKGNYQRAMQVIYDIFGLMVAVDTKEIFIYKYGKGIYENITLDQFTGMYSYLTKEDTSRTTASVFKKKVFEWFGFPWSMKREKIESLFAKNKKKYIHFKNGLYDLEKESFGPHSRSVHFKNGITSNYLQEGYSCPKFLKFLDEITLGSQDKMQTLLEYSAYAMIPSYDYGHHFLMLCGTGRNGKSTFVQTIANIVGPNACCSVPIEGLEGYSLAGMSGKLLNHCEESSGKKVAGKGLANLKSITGGDSVEVRQIYGKTYVESLFPKMMFSMNEVPSFSEANEALSSRMIYVNCDLDLEGKLDTSLGQALKDERDNIATMLVERIKDFRKRGRIHTPSTSKATTEQIERAGGLYMSFYHDRLMQTKDLDDVLWFDSLYDDFKKYAESEDVSTYDRFSLGKALKGKILPKYIKRKRNNGKFRNAYLGFKLQPWLDTQDD